VYTYEISSLLLYTHFYLEITPVASPTFLITCINYYCFHILLMCYFFYSGV